MKHEPGERFAYCNGGYVVLALLAERASGVPFHDLVEQRVCRPAGMTDTSFLRSDELPGRAAVGYLDDDGLRTNVLHLPVRGNGDGGIYTTAADVHALWDALFAGRIVSLDTVAEMVRPRSDVPEDSMRYGLGFWLYDSTGAVSLHGFDAGVGFVSVRDRGHGSPTPFCPTRAAGHGRSVNASTSCSQHRRDHRQRGATAGQPAMRRASTRRPVAVVRIDGRASETASPTAGQAPQSATPQSRLPSPSRGTRSASRPPRRRRRRVGRGRSPTARSSGT